MIFLIICKISKIGSLPDNTYYCVKQNVQSLFNQNLTVSLEFSISKGCAYPHVIFLFPQSLLVILLVQMASLINLINMLLERCPEKVAKICYS